MDDFIEEFSEDKGISGSIFYEIHDEQDAISPIDVPKIRMLCESILDDANITTGNLGVAIVDNDTIHELNNHFLKHDYPTDVLSFVIDEDRKNGFLEGEVIVSAEMARDRADEFSWTAEDELMLYITHGLLHLVGYNDIEKDDADKMRQKEAEYLEKFGIVFPNDDDF